MPRLGQGASPHAAAKNGYTPLHISAKKNQLETARYYTTLFITFLVKLEADLKLDGRRCLTLKSKKPPTARWRFFTFSGAASFLFTYLVMLRGCNKLAALHITSRNCMQMCICLGNPTMIISNKLNNITSNLLYIVRQLSCCYSFCVAICL